MLGFKNASLAKMNHGIITTLLSLYCVFTTLIFYFVFGERLQRKFIFGIAFMLACVVFVACPDKSPSTESKH